MKSVLEAAITLIEGSFEDRSQKVREALRAEFQSENDDWVYVSATFPTSVVWEKESKDKGSQYFISNYSITEEGKVDIMNTKEIELVTGYQLAAEQWLEKEFGSVEKAMIALTEKEAPKDYKSIVGALMLINKAEEKKEPLDADTIWELIK